MDKKIWEKARLLAKQEYEENYGSWEDADKYEKEDFVHSVYNRIWKTEMRILQLKAMHSLILSSNDESLYMIWIAACVPDCPNEDDFESIAENDESYNECFNMFCKLIQKKGMRY